MVILLCYVKAYLKVHRTIDDIWKFNDNLKQVHYLSVLNRTVTLENTIFEIQKHVWCVTFRFQISRQLFKIIPYYVTALQTCVSASNHTAKPLCRCAQRTFHRGKKKLKSFAQNAARNSNSGLSLVYVVLSTCACKDSCDLRTCEWGGECVREERDSIWVSVVKGNRTIGAAKALRFQPCAAFIRLIFRFGCCRFFVETREAVALRTFFMTFEYRTGYRDPY